MSLTKIPGKKKDGKQAYRVRINYTDANGNYKQVERTEYGKEESKLLEQKLIEQYKNHPEEHPKPDDMTVQALFDKYQEVKKHEVRASTLDKTVRNLSYHVIPTLGNKKLKQLTSELLIDWKTEMNNKGLAIQTRKNVYSDFHVLLNFAVTLDKLAKNPLNKVGNFKDSDFVMPEDKLQYYTPDEFVRFIAVARDQSHDMRTWGAYVFFNLAFFTGMRKGEINALTWADIDGKIINVHRSVSLKLKGKTGKSVVETATKNQSSYRSLQIPAPLMQVLAEQMARQKKADPRWSTTYRVCGGPACIGDTYLTNRNKFIADVAGIHQIRIHDFRHSHASLLANEGINIKEIARRLGHSNVQITWKTYAHLYPREDERALVVLDRVKTN